MTRGGGVVAVLAVVVLAGVYVAGGEALHLAVVGPVTVAFRASGVVAVDQAGRDGGGADHFSSPGLLERTHNSPQHRADGAAAIDVDR